MKNLITIALIIISLTTNGQIGMSDKSAKIQRLDICKKLLYTTDTIGERYLSSILKYDSIGREIHNEGFNKSGDVIAEEITTYYGDSVEITICNEKDIVDTAICFYDGLGREHYEYWYWGEENDSEETYYYYKYSSDTLICIHDIYSWGGYHDSLFYKNNLLMIEVSYDDEYGIETEIKYKYQDTLLIEKTKFDFVTELLDFKETYAYDDNSRLTITVSEYYDTHRKEEKKYSYHENDIIKEEIITRYENSSFTESCINTYDSNGLQTNSTCKNSSGKITMIEFIYLKNDECTATNTS